MRLGLAALLLALPVLALPVMAGAAPLAEIHSQSGSRPPPNDWHETTTLADDGTVTSRRCWGSGRDNPDCTERHGAISAQSVAHLREALDQTGLAGWPPIMDTHGMFGGPSLHIVIWLDGRQIDLPQYPPPEFADVMAYARQAVQATLSAAVYDD